MAWFALTICWRVWGVRAPPTMDEEEEMGVSSWARREANAELEVDDGALVDPVVGPGALRLPVVP